MAENLANVQSIKYGSKMIDVTQECTLIAKRFPFNKQEAGIGSEFKVPVQLTRSANFTPGGTTPANLASRTARSITYNFASAVSNEILLTTQINFGDVTRVAGGEVQFMNASADTPRQMAASAGMRTDFEMLYGRSPVATCSGTGTVSATVRVVHTIADTSWSPGLFYAMEGQEVDVFTDNAATSASNTAGAGFIYAVDEANKQVTVEYASGANATTIAALTAPQLWFYGTRVGANDGTAANYKQMQGIFGAVTATTGSQFGIPVSYSGWRGRQIALGSPAALSFSLINQAASRLAAIGLKKKLLAVVSHKGWEQAMNEQAALRMYDSSYSTKKLANGAESLEYFSVNGGSIEVLAHPCVKNSHAFIIDEDSWVRGGSTDWTFSLPGFGQLMQTIPSTTMVEILAYADQCIIPKRLANNVVITNLTP